MVAMGLLWLRVLYVSSASLCVRFFSLTLRQGRMSDPFAGNDASPFGRRQRRPRGARIPVTVVTGFLGAGKTTLIRELLTRPEGANTAVVVNEFGEIGIDHALLRSSSDTTVLLGNGCICRAVRAAPVATAIDGAIDPAFLLEESLDLSARVAAHEHDHAHAHSHGIDSFAVFFEGPVPWAVFEQAMAVLTGLRGADLLRVKGLVAVEGCRGPIVVHAVQHVAHRPVELEDWPDDDRRSRLVFITRNLPREPVERLFAAVTGVAR